MSTAFVCGNGKSRLQFKLEILRKYGPIYGCNKMYEDYMPDYLVAVDPPMVKQIIKDDVHKKIPLWTNKRSRLVDYPDGVNFFKPSRGWSSGPTALLLASQQGAKQVFILGFDFGGDNGQFNNVYADTEHYKKSTDAPTFFGNWIRQTLTIAKEFPNTKYYRVITNHFDYTPKDLDGLHNFRQIKPETMQEMLTSAI